jgi:hypothetical protein
LGVMPVEQRNGHDKKLVHNILTPLDLRSCLGRVCIVSGQRRYTL